MAAVHRTAHQPSLPPALLLSRATHPTPRLSNRRAVVPAIFRRLFRSVSFRLSFPSRHRSRVSFHRSFHFPSALYHPHPLWPSLLLARSTKRRDREWHPAGLSHPVASSRPPFPPPRPPPPPPANPRRIPSLSSEIFRFHDNYCRSISLWFCPIPSLRSVFHAERLSVRAPAAASLSLIFHPPTSEIRVPKIAANAR